MLPTEVVLNCDLQQEPGNQKDILTTELFGGGG